MKRCLDLSNCAQVTNSVVRAVLQGCSSLQTLRLDGCRHITDAAFQPDHSPFYPLRACTSLQVVSFARCSQLTKSLVVFLIKACRSLTDINFSRCKVGFCFSSGDEEKCFGKWTNRGFLDPTFFLFSSSASMTTPFTCLCIRRRRWSG